MSNPTSLKETIKKNLGDRKALESLIDGDIIQVEQLIIERFFPVEVFSILDPALKTDALMTCVENSFTPDASFIEHLISSKDVQNLLFIIKNFKTIPIDLPTTIGMMNIAGEFTPCVGELIVQDRLILHNHTLQYVVDHVQDLSEHLLINRNLAYKILVGQDEFGLRHVTEKFTGCSTFWNEISYELFLMASKEGKDLIDFYKTSYGMAVKVPRSEIFRVPFPKIYLTEEMLDLTLDEAIEFTLAGKQFINQDNIKVPVSPVSFVVSYKSLSMFADIARRLGDRFIKYLKENPKSIHFIGHFDRDLKGYLVTCVLCRDHSLYKTIEFYFNEVLSKYEIARILRESNPPKDDEGFYKFLKSVAGRGGGKTCDEYFTEVPSSPFYIHKKKIRTGLSNKELFEKMVSAITSYNEGHYDEAIANGYTVDKFIDDVNSKVSYRKLIDKRFCAFNRLNFMSKEEIYKIVGCNLIGKAVSNNKSVNTVKFTHTEIIENELYKKCSQFEDLVDLCKSPKDLFKYLLKDPKVLAHVQKERMDLGYLLGWDENKYESNIKKLDADFADIAPFILSKDRIMEMSNLDTRDNIRSYIGDDILDHVHLYQVNNKGSDGAFILTELEASKLFLRAVHTRTLHSKTSLKSLIEEVNQRLGEDVYKLLERYSKDKSIVSEFGLSGNRRNLNVINSVLGEFSPSTTSFNLEDYISNGKVNFAKIKPILNKIRPQLDQKPNLPVYVASATTGQLNSILDLGLKNRIHLTRLNFSSNRDLAKKDLSMVDIKTVEMRDFDADFYNLVSNYGTDRFKEVKVALTPGLEWRKANILESLVNRGFQFANKNELLNEPWLSGSRNNLAIVLHKVDLTQDEVRNISGSLPLLEILAQRLNDDFSRFVFTDDIGAEKLEFIKARNGTICSPDMYTAYVFFKKEIENKAGIYNFKNVFINGQYKDTKFNLIRILEEKDPRFSSLSLLKSNLSDLSVIHNFEEMKESGVSINEKDLMRKLDIPANFNNKKVSKGIVDIVALKPSLVELYRKILEVRDMLCPSVEFDGGDFFDLRDPTDIKCKFDELSSEDVVKILEARDLVFNPEIKLFANVDNKKSLVRVIKEAGSSWVLRDCTSMLRTIYNGLVSLREENRRIVEICNDSGEDYNHNENYLGRAKTIRGIETKLIEISAIDSIRGIHDRAVTLSSLIKDDPNVIVSKRYFLNSEVSNMFTIASEGYVPYFPETRGDLYLIGPMHGWCVHSARSYEKNVIEQNAVLVGLIPRDKEFTPENIVALANFHFDTGSQSYYIEQLRWSKIVKGQPNVCAISEFPVKKIAQLLTEIYMNEMSRKLAEEKSKKIA